MEDISKGILIDDMFYDKQDIINMIRLQKQLVIEESKLFSLEECINIWQNYSWDLAASWLFLPEKDEDILKQVRSSYKFTTFEEYAK